MFGTKLLNARQLTKELGIGYTTFFRLIKQKNSKGQAVPVHQLGQTGRKYYVLDEVRAWLLD